jgi:uncharacterized protein YoxC
MAHLAATLVDACVSLAASVLMQAAGAAQGGALPDTIVTVQAPIQPGWFERLQETLRALMTLAILVLTVAVVPAAWNFRKSYQKVSDLLDRVYADVNPLTHHAARIAENVDYVTTAVRADAQRASAVLAQAEARLAAAIERAEARARDFEALVEVAQQEAERTLVSAASTAAGVREGVASLRDDLAAAWRGDGPRAGTEVAASSPPDAPPGGRGPGADPRESNLLAADVLGGTGLPDDMALVDVRRTAARGPAAPRVPSGSAGGPDDFSDGVTDASLDPMAARPPLGPRLRPRDRG